MFIDGNPSPESGTSEHGNPPTELRIANPNIKPQLEASGSSSFNVAKTFEDLLLSTIRQNPNPEKQRRTRVCQGSEVLTTVEVLSRLQNKPTLKNKVQVKGIRKKKPK